jgi:methionyl-tRNA formyltransferase
LILVAVGYVLAGRVIRRGNALSLAPPYPGAFTFYNGQKLKLLTSKLTDRPYIGEPGRIYRKVQNRILVCAKDKCLWIDEIVDFHTSQNVYTKLKRYEKLATVRDSVKRLYEN